MSILRAVSTLVVFVVLEALHPIRSTQHEAWPVSSAWKAHCGFAINLKMERKPQLALFAEGSRQGHFFGFVFFTADFLAPFFALLFPLPMTALAAR